MMSAPQPPNPAAPPIHTHACVLSIGDELVLGQMLDTNSRELSRRLMNAGVQTVEHATIGDSLDATRDAIVRLSARAPLLILTGGLGPTLDDLTREALAAVLGERLVEDAPALAALDARLRSRGRDMTPAQQRQTQRPASAICLANDHGTAPGLYASIRAPGAGPANSPISEVFCLPGPPNEWMPMFERHVLPRIRVPNGYSVRTRLMHMFGLSEADAASMIPGLMDRDRVPLVGITASGGVLTWRLRFAGKATPQHAERELDQTADLIRSRMGRYIFAEGKASMASAVVGELKRQRLTLAVVESCTGGMLGGHITDVAGASAVFQGGWITYSNTAKRRDVGVSGQTLERDGAVSAQTVHEMARGGLARSGADCCLAISGVAGPDGGTPEKPIGTVWIALARREANASGSTAPSPGVRSIALRLLIPGQRADVRERACTAALGMLWFSLAGLLSAPDAPRLLWQTARDEQ